MDMSVVHSVDIVERPKMKIIFMKLVEGNPNLTLFIMPNNVVYLEDVGSYLTGKFEIIGSEYMN